MKKKKVLHMLSNMSYDRSTRTAPTVCAETSCRLRYSYQRSVNFQKETLQMKKSLSELRSAYSQVTDLVMS